MKQDTKLLMVLIGAVLITSGCMNGESGEASSEALAVNEFSTSPNPAPADQNTNMQMQLENVGDATAEDVNVYIFGPAIDDDDRTWTAEEGQIMQFGDLGEAQENQPAIPQQETLTLKSPNIAEGRNLPYDFNSQIYYGYGTTASTTIELMSQERYQETGATQSSTTAQNSDGPIHIDIQGSTPIVFQPDSEGVREEELCIIVNNVATGSAFDYDDLPVLDSNSEYDEDIVTVEIEDVGGVEFQADNEDEDERDTNIGVEADIELIGNEGFHCYTMEASSGQNLEQTVNIELEAEYGYIEETSTSITVEGRGTGSTGSTDSTEDDSEDSEDTGPPPMPGGD